MDASLAQSLPAQYAEISALTAGIVQLINSSDPNDKWNRFYPVFSFVIGGVLGWFFGLPWYTDLTIGMFTSGIYRGAKVVAKGA